MSINDPEAYARSQPDWDSIFPRQDTLWRLSDMDGFGERNGEFLHVEWKGPGVAIDWSKGQGLALMRLAHTPHSHVLILWGVAPDGPVTAYQCPARDEEPLAVKDSEHIDEYRRWLKWAGKQSPKRLE